MNNVLRLSVLTVLATAWRPEARAESPEQATATTICQAFKENEVAAEEKFKGKTLEVSGKVRRVCMTTRPAAACIELEDETAFSSLRLKCRFDPKEAETLLAVEKGQQVRLSGTCDGKEPFGVKLSSCKLLEPAPKKVPEKDTPKDDAGTKDKPLEIKATDLARSYQANEIAADRRFKGKVVQIQGQVKRVHKKRATPCVDLTTGLELSLLSIECHCDTKQSSDLGKLTKGQEVILVGKVNGMGLFNTVEIEECVLTK